MADSKSLHLPRRMRRLRQSAATRDLLAEVYVQNQDLIAPLFVHDEGEAPQPVSSMPNICRRSIRGAVEEAKRLRDQGIMAAALFPCLKPELKDEMGSEAFNRDTLVLRLVRELKRQIQDLIVITDVALDPYTSHGHDGLLNASRTDVLNDETVEALARMAVLQAEAGADWVAPSDMMDGRVGAIRQALDQAGWTQTCILSYAAKFCSAYYGPFREAAGSLAAASGVYLDKRTYQLNPANRREALMDALLDEAEGADLLMVKPAGLYLDILRDLRERTDLPLVAYQVSGEYSQIHAAAKLGWLDLAKCREESLLAIKRAGADLIISYFAGSR